MRDKETTLSFQSLRATEVNVNHMNKIFETKAVSRMLLLFLHAETLF